MTLEEKQVIEKKIIELIFELAKDGTTDAMMFLHGDNQYQNASFVIKGDSILLANTIQHHIQHNEEFRRFIFAVIGSYLSGNPEQEREFLGGLRIVKNNLGTKFVN